MQEPTAEEIVYLRTSERNTYRRCRQRWYWQYAGQLQPKTSASALRFGTLIHKALAAWYPPGRKRGTHPREAFEALFAEEGHIFGQWDEDGMKADPLTLGLTMCDGYVKQYGKDPDIEILQPEMAFKLHIYDRQGNYLCTYVGRYDAIYMRRSVKRIGIMEHKTCKSMPGKPVRVNSFYGEQGLTYWWAANQYLREIGWLKKDKFLEEILYNFLRKGLPDERKKDANGYALNLDGTISKKQPAKLFHRDPLKVGRNELKNIERRIRGEAWEIQQARQGKLPIIKSPSMDCDWDCPFIDVCELHEMGGDYKSVLKLEFQPYDPYSDYELEFELD